MWLLGGDSGGGLRAGGRVGGRERHGERSSREEHSVHFSRVSVYPGGRVIRPEINGP